jgi:O-antigen ligase
MITALVAIVLALPLLPPGYVDRLTTLGQIGTVDATTDVSIRARTAETTAGIEMFLDHPVTGVGIGNYKDHYPEYARDQGIDARRKAREPHNLYLEIAAETGLPGIAAFVFLIGGTFAAVVAGRRRFAAAGLQDEAGASYAVGVALVGYLITSLFLHMDFARLFWLITGVALALPGIASREAAARPEREPAG